MRLQSSPSASFEEPQSEIRIVKHPGVSSSDVTLHDMRNLLASVRANADFIHATLEPSSDPEMFGALMDIAASAERIGVVFEAALQTRAEAASASSRSPVPLTALVERVVRDADLIARECYVTISITKGEDAILLLDRALFARLLRTLVEKAIRSSSAHDTVEVCCGVHGKLVVVSVATPNGSLLAESSKAHAPDSWVDSDTQVDIATDELAFCLGAARAHDGTLRIQGRRGGGSLAVVSVPLKRLTGASTG